MATCMKEAYSAKELASMRLQTLPHAHCNVRNRAKREGWPSEKRTGRGAGEVYPISGLPDDVQAEIRNRHAVKLLSQPVKSAEERAIDREVSLAMRDVTRLNDKQRQTCDARLAVVVHLRRIAAEVGVNRAVALVSAQSRDGTLAPEIAQWLDKAVARKAGAGVGERTLKQWMADANRCDNPTERLATFAPHKTGRPMARLEGLRWLPEFLRHYRLKNGVGVNEAYRSFATAWAVAHEGDVSALPNIYKVRRALAQIPNVELLRGRLTGAALRAHQTYVKRDWSQAHINDVWMGDGHSLKMKVQHPDHGQPFTPELTMIMDTRSRMIVGWSLAYSESCIAVGDALRHAIGQHGVPAIYYSDNGSGQTNKVLDTDVFGVLPRLGIEHQTGLPGNPQGRGMIERLNQTVGHLIARQFETYYGGGADPETVRENLTGVASLAKALAEKKTVLTPKQVRAKGKLPRWDDLLKVIEAVIHHYNHEREHSEIQCTPAALYAALLAEAKEGEIVRLSEIELRDMFRPQFTRVVRRGWLELHNKDYWHRELEKHDGETVVMAVDQHDPTAVIVKSLDGDWICDAKLDGNKRPGFAESLVESARRKRAEAAIKRAKHKAEQAAAELRPAIEGNTAATLREILGTGTDGQKAAEPEYQFLKTAMRKEA
ncbi:Mu transposase C-terminal domain-containing protein [Cardiobacterium hominis]|uniref:Mu transposase C-terminal domain-containing protein n=1 Tax=Cardiobacterium hominis TaxID=2718 RepID=UPI0028D2E933|nr:Mu transposase C-terminal domain-containing protein [Cardiobacterium hominis]